MEFGMTGLIVVLLAGVAMAAAVVFLMLRNRGGGDLAGVLNDLQAQNAELAGRLTQIAEDGRKSQGELAKAVQERLDKVSERMGKSLEVTASKTAKSMGEIETRLKVIDEAQKNITALSGDIVGLQDILSNKQSRGQFGELQLNDLVTNILPPSAYDLQATLSNSKRADCLILLPNPPGPIVVDAKFPLESYYALRAAEDDGAKTAASRAFAADILKHVKDISERYIIAGETAESALMFLPSEAVYAELHASFPEVVEKSYRARVWIVSPTTLMATLNTVRAVLKDVKMREQAGLIQKEVGALLKDVFLLDNRVSKLSKHFDLAGRDLHDIGISTGKIAKRAKGIEEVQIEEEGGTEEAVEEAPQGPRLVAD